MKPLDYWIEPDEKIYSFDFWNDAELEESKPWAIKSVDDPSMKNHLDSLGAFDDFKTVWSAVPPSESLKVLDVAAGTCWASALFSVKENVEEVCSIDFSVHRLERYAPMTIEALGGNKDKIQRCYGSFYDIKKPDDYFDIIFMGSSFHHAEDPLRLLRETGRVLKPNGLFLLIGETRVAPYLMFRRFVKTLLLERAVEFDFAKLFPPVHESGDHYYNPRMYRELFHSIERTPEIRKGHHDDHWTVVAR